MVENMISFLCSLLSFAIIINLIVVVHEYGHFQAARRAGVTVSKFSIGMGPELFGFTDKLGTRWCFAAFPVGGYVLMLGDGDISSTTDNSEEIAKLSEEEKQHTFESKTNWQKMWIAFCGPLFNYIYAIVVLIFMGFFVGIPKYAPIAETVKAGSPADLCGMHVGDKILSIDGKPVNNFRDVTLGIHFSEGETIKFEIERAGDIHEVIVHPEIIEEKKPWGSVRKRKVVGIGSGSPIFEKSGFVDSVVNAFKFCWKSTVEMSGLFGRLFSGKSSIDNFGGVVQIARTSGNLSQSGSIGLLIMFTITLSLNLGFINLLPLPILDGGRIVISMIEQIIGRKVNEKFLEYIMVACMILLIFVMLLTTVNDIFNIEMVRNFVSNFMR